MQREGAYFKGLSQQEKELADEFFIGMSLNEDEDKYEWRTLSKQVEHEEHLRDWETWPKHKMFGGDESVEAKK